MPALAPILRKLLACPACKRGLRQQEQFLVCSRCGKAYPILDGVPDMLPADAWTLAKARKAKFAHALKLVPARNQGIRARA